MMTLPSCPQLIPDNDPNPGLTQQHIKLPTFLPFFCLTTGAFLSNNTSTPNSTFGSLSFVIKRMDLMQWHMLLPENGIPHSEPASPGGFDDQARLQEVVAGTLRSNLPWMVAI
jgi:hypothetical protein